jgi:hypothetical protein
MVQNLIFDSDLRCEIRKFLRTLALEYSVQGTILASKARHMILQSFDQKKNIRMIQFDSVRYGWYGNHHNFNDEISNPNYWVDMW